MKKVLVLVLSLFIGFNYVAVSGDAEMEYFLENTEVITEDVLFEINDAVEGSEYLFSFTAPNTGYFVFETYGEVDTSVELNNNTQDIDNGNSENEAKGFEAIGSSTYTFTVTAEDITGDDVIYVQVRQQTISVYAVEDYLPNPTDTTANIDTVEDMFGDNGTYEDMYKVEIYKNFGSDFYYKTNDDGLNGLNSEILIFSSHGDDGKFSYYNGSGYTYIDSDNMPDMSNVKIVIWAACHSAEGTSSLDSIAQESIDQGADVAIGWTGSLGTYTSSLFIGYLLEELADNTNSSIQTLVDLAYVSTNAQLIAEQYMELDSIAQYDVFGGDSTVITLSASDINSKGTSNFIPAFSVDNPSTPTINTISVTETLVKFKYTNNTDRIVRVCAEKFDSTPDQCNNVLEPGEYVYITYSGLVPDRWYKFYVRFEDYYRPGLYSTTILRNVKTLGGDIIIW